MSDVVKWAIIIGVCVVCVGLLVSFLVASDYLNGIGMSLAEANAWLGNYSVYLVQGRKLLNNFFPPNVLTIALWFALFYKLAEWTISLARIVIDAIYKD